MVGALNWCHRVKDMKRVAFLLILAGLGCVVAYSVIGSSIAEDGTLVEPFFLIPIAWLLLLTGGMLAIATFIKSRFK